MNLSLLRAELAPSPGRWQGTLQITILCVLVSLLAMVFQVPEAALSCYLIFFAWRDDAATGAMAGIGLIVVASVCLLLAIPMLQLAVSSGIWRMGFLLGLTLFGMALAQASIAPPVIGTLTFVFAFAVTMYDVVPDPDFLTRGLAWMWVVVALPMGLLVLMAIVAGRSPKAAALEVIAARRAALTSPRSPDAQALLHEAGTRCDVYVKRAAMLGECRGSAADRLAAEAEASYYDLARAAAGLPLRFGPHAPAHDIAARPAFAADFFRNPLYWQFGFKVMLCVLITYMIYTAGGLFEIHTAMITCFFVALGSGAETRHKISLRIIGAVLGAVLGAFVLFAVMPWADDIGHLMAIVALGALPAAWISLGSERVAYAGWQLALCYFLVVLGGFGPIVDLSAAVDRLLGIAIGVGVVWAVFSLLWPVSAKDKANLALDEFDALMARTAGHVLTGRATMDLYAAMSEAERLWQYLPFEDTQCDAVRARIESAQDRLAIKLRTAVGDPYA